MSRYVLFIVSIIFCFIGARIITYKTGNHDVDFFMKIIGIIILIPFLLILLSALKIIW